MIGLLLLFTTPSYAMEKVTVEIPNFNTYINDTIIDNKNEKYPMIVYNDITYFPMTYGLCREIGLAVNWDMNKGLYIANYITGLQSHESTFGNNRDKYYYAIVPEYPITINGKKIDNSQEEYPLLNFRDITYFPMTWRFINDEFGWTIKFDEKDGLNIYTYNENPTMYLKESNEDYALFEKHEMIYENTQNENGDIVSTLKGDKYHTYKFNYENEELTYLGENRKIDVSEKNQFDDISDKFEIKANKLYYENNEILEISDVDSSSGVEVFGYKWTFDKESFLAVTLYYNLNTPAPYTPKLYYVFKQSEKISNIEEWDNAKELQYVYKVNDGYYLCSNHRFLGGRWNNNSGSVIFIDKNGVIINFNKKYTQYESLRTIGMYNDKLYVLATWYPNSDKVTYNGDVNLINDGFFYIDSNEELNKIYDFVYGEYFISPKGELYCIRKNTNQIINLTTGKEIEER